MRVRAESQEQAETMMQDFATRADMLGSENRYANFDLSSLNRSELAEEPWTGVGSSEDFKRPPAED